MCLSKVYTVHAYRWGDREKHSYSVGVYTDEKKALEIAEAESEYRGGKYECEVLEWIPDLNIRDDVPGMPCRIVLALPVTSTLNRGVIHD